MKTNTVYRVEHSFYLDDGPFTSSHSPVGYGVEVCPTHPSIVDDTGFNIMNWPNSLVCGCSSIEMLRHWFNNDEWVRALNVARFCIAVYEVPTNELYHGKSGTQVAFVNDDEYRKERISILKLLDIR